jgi:hypothetical protein
VVARRRLRFLALFGCLFLLGGLFPTRFVGLPWFFDYQWGLWFGFVLLGSLLCWGVCFERFFLPSLLLLFGVGGFVGEVPETSRPENIGVEVGFGWHGNPQSGWWWISYVLDAFFRGFWVCCEARDDCARMVPMRPRFSDECSDFLCDAFAVVHFVTYPACVGCVRTRPLG